MLLYWIIFRFIFVLLFLYLLGDIFYRWDGFSYYASLSEYLPSVALISTLWSIIAVIISTLVFLLLIPIEWLCSCKGLKVKREQFILFTAIFILSGIFLSFSKNYLHYGLALSGKILTILSITFIAALLTWLFRNSSERYVKLCHYHISPLVYLFAAWVVFSVLLVIYHADIVQPEIKKPKETVQSYSKMNRPNIILITFDAMTSRDMFLYGYHRPTTPFISEWANTASVFTRLQAASNYTRSTIASLLTGKRVWTHQVYHSDQRAMPETVSTENLFKLLQQIGYYNIDISCSLEASLGEVSNHANIVPPVTIFQKPVVLKEIIEDWLFRFFGNQFKLFDWFVKEDFILHPLLNRLSTDYSVTTRRPNVAFNKFLEVLDEGAQSPYFARIHLYPPHFGYLPPKPYMGMFDSSSELRTGKSQQSFVKKLRKIIDSKERITAENNRKLLILRARYDEYIRYCDDQFKEFIRRLDAKNRLKSTVIILSSDHGESFEHDYYSHGGPFLFEQVTHIPLIIKEPGQRNGRIIDDLVEQIDIPATILDLAEITIPSWMEGRSVLPLLRDEKLPEKPIFSVNFENNRSHGHLITNGTIAVWEGDLKLIHYLETKDSQLFNLRQDPAEINNIFDEETQKSRHLLNLIKTALHNANDKFSKGE